MKRFITLFCCLPFIWLATTCAIADEINCFWTSGARLLPAWGFYPNGSSYGGTTPLGKASAWTSGGGTHKLTWVADFPADGVWQVWVRQYGGYGEVAVEVDGRTVVGGRGGPGGGRYVWRHQGGVNVPVGSHHVDLTVNHGMLDAVLFVDDRDFDPVKAEFPEPAEKPMLRGMRAFRKDEHLAGTAGARGFVVGQVTPYAEIRYDWVPHPERLINSISLWGSAGQSRKGQVEKDRHYLLTPRLSFGIITISRCILAGGKYHDGGSESVGGCERNSLLSLHFSVCEAGVFVW